MLTILIFAIIGALIPIIMFWNLNKLIGFSFTLLFIPMGAMTGWFVSWILLGVINYISTSCTLWACY